jgi:uncharacterized membrane protein (DUF2068 family)
MQTSPTVATKRPGSFIVMILLRALNGFFGMFTGALLLTSSDVALMGGVVLSLSILSLLLIVGLWVLQPWARRLTIGLIALTLPMGVLGIFMSGGRDPGTYLGIIGDSYTLYLLFQPRIKQLFA